VAPLAVSQSHQAVRLQQPALPHRPEKLIAYGLGPDPPKRTGMIGDSSPMVVASIEGASNSSGFSSHFPFGALLISAWLAFASVNAMGHQVGPISAPSARAGELLPKVRSDQPR
jgi:hypothetical protein